MPRGDATGKRDLRDRAVRSLSHFTHALLAVDEQLLLRDDPLAAEHGRTGQASC